MATPSCLSYALPVAPLRARLADLLQGMFVPGELARALWRMRGGEKVIESLSSDPGRESAENYSIEVVRVLKRLGLLGRRFLEMLKEERSKFVAEIEEIEGVLINNSSIVIRCIAAGISSCVL